MRRCGEFFMVIRIDDERLLRMVKGLSIFLVVCAVVVFLWLSGMVFNFSVSNPTAYEVHFSRLSVPEQTVAASMRKTGEVGSKVIGSKRVSGNSKFFDEVEKIHGKK